MSVEQNRHHIEIVAEGVVALNRKLDAFRDEVNERFQWVDQRFEWVGERFQQVDRRLDGVDERFDGIDRRLDRMDERFDGIDRRFDGMDRRFDEQRDSTSSALALLSRRVNDLESELN